MYLVVGLGNPGPKYADNRHNVGFMVTELLADRWNAGAFREKFNGSFSKTSHRGEDVILLKPETFMNLSGESVQKAMKFFKVDLEDVIVVHDELDLAYEDTRIKVGGGLAGHNGLKSIAKQCGGNGFVRVRVGIGRPRSGATEGYVLGNFDADQRARLDDVLERAATLVEAIVSEGAKAAMNRHHRK